MSDAVPVKLQQTRESIQRAVGHIERCFTAGDTVADQVGRACDLLLDFSKQFGVDQRHRHEAITLKGTLNDLVARERAQEITNDDFRTESAGIRRRALELTQAMADAAESHLAKVESSLQPATESISPRVLPPSPLRESFEKFLQQESSADEVVFRSRGMGKRYGLGGPFVIENLDIELRSGEITGLIGLNGSGKTTILRMVAGALEATTGQWEYPALKCAPTSWITIRRSIAFVAQRPERWNGTVEDALTLQAACFGDTGKRGKTLVDFYIARLGLTPYQHFTWAQLSGGYRTRFELAKAMLSRPRMLVLDEPLAALDIPTQMRFLLDLRDFSTTFAQPMPVLISSQHIYEIEAIADRLVVIRNGKAVYNGPTRGLGEERAVNGFEVSCNLDVAAITVALADSGLKSIEQIGPTESFVTVDNSVTARHVIEALIRANATVRHFRDVSRSSRMFFES